MSREGLWFWTRRLGWLCSQSHENAWLLLGNSFHGCVKVVEKWWVSLWKSRWENGGKFYTDFTDGKFCTFWWIRIHNLWESVESFTSSFTHRFNSGMSGVLHIFHRAYYNYY